MIQGVFGLPGMGKSTLLAKCAFQNLEGKTFLDVPPHSYVFTNFACPRCYQLDFDSLGKVFYHDSLFLIDEIMLLCDSRNYRNFSNELKEFFALHRHYNNDIVWCSQNYRDTDLKIRNLTQRYFLLEKSAFFPISYVKPILHGLGVEKGDIQDGYRLGAPITWRFVYRPRYYSLFDSFETRPLPEPDYKLWDTYGSAVCIKERGEG